MAPVGATLVVAQTLPLRGEEQGDHKGRPYGIDNRGLFCAPSYWPVAARLAATVAAA